MSIGRIVGLIALIFLGLLALLFSTCGAVFFFTGLAGPGKDQYGLTGFALVCLILGIGALVGIGFGIRSVLKPRRKD